MTGCVARVMCVQMQDEDDVNDETSGKDFVELVQLTRRHISEVARLESLREVEVDVTVTTRKELVLLPPGLRVRAPALCEDDGELLWSPPGARTEAKVAETTESIVTRQRLPLEMPVEGVFVRQWGERPGQFNEPYAVAVWGQEVVVCDRDNHRVQVFGLDGTFVRQWGEAGAGPGQFNQPCGVAVVGCEVVVCDIENHRMQVFK